MKKRHLPAILIMGLAVTLWFSPVQPACSQEGFSRLVEAEGLATIINNDVGMAREMAVFEAQKRAVEPLGIQVDSDTIYSMGLQIADWYKIKVGGYVKSWEVIEEKRINDGFRVRIKAWVKSGEAETEETKRLLSLRKILLICKGEGSSAIEEGLIRELSPLGYRYHDSEYIRKNLRPATWDNLVNRRILSLDSDAFKFMADLVIHMESSVGAPRRDNDLGGTWFNGDGKVRLFQISGEQRGEPVIEESHSSTRLFGRSQAGSEKEDALTTGHPNGFRKQVAAPMVSKFMKRLSESEGLKMGSRVVTVNIAGVPSQAEFAKFLTILKNQRGVQGQVEVLSQEGDTYTVNARFPMKTVYLAYLLSVSNQYRLKAHDWNRIELEYHK